MDSISDRTEWEVQLNEQYLNFQPTTNCIHLNLSIDCDNYQPISKLIPNHEVILKSFALVPIYIDSACLSWLPRKITGCIHAVLNGSIVDSYIYNPTKYYATALEIVVISTFNLVVDSELVNIDIVHSSGLGGIELINTHHLKIRAEEVVKRYLGGSNKQIIERLNFKYDKKLQTVVLESRNGSIFHHIYLN